VTDLIDISKICRCFVVDKTVINKILMCLFDRGNPAVQCNAVMALAGLALATQHFVTSLDNKDLKRANEFKEHMSHSHWLMLVIDSCMSLVDFTYKPKAGLLGLCQQVRNTYTINSFLTFSFNLKLKMVK